MTSVLVGASSVKQLEDNLAATANLAFDAEELDRIGTHAVDTGINLWSPSSAV